MANTPKKVKDPTEVALSAIQEALNISEQGAENRKPPQRRRRAAEPAARRGRFFSHIVRVPSE
ncbi:hypothetical protein [Bradyrhizobium sp. USDA 3256]